VSLLQNISIATQVWSYIQTKPSITHIIDKERLQYNFLFLWKWKSWISGRELLPLKSNVSKTDPMLNQKEQRRSVRTSSRITLEEKHATDLCVNSFN
jgi:hypothetical protein